MKPKIFIFRHLSQRNEMYILAKTSMKVFIASLFIMAQNQRVQITFTGQTGKQTELYILYGKPTGQMGKSINK